MKYSVRIFKEKHGVQTSCETSTPYLGVAKKAHKLAKSFIGRTVNGRRVVSVELNKIK